MQHTSQGAGRWRTRGRPGGPPSLPRAGRGRRADRGATGLEYGLVVAGISMTALLGISTVGSTVADAFTCIRDRLADPTAASTCADSGGGSGSGAPADTSGGGTGSSSGSGSGTLPDPTVTPTDTSTQTATATTPSADRDAERDADRDADRDAERDADADGHALTHEGRPASTGRPSMHASGEGTAGRRRSRCQLTQAWTLSGLASTHFFAASSGVILSTAMYFATRFWSSLVHWNFSMKS